MPKKRITPEDDPRRLAERVQNDARERGLIISDRDTFDQAYVNYLSGTDALDNKTLMNNTFEELRKADKKIRNERTFKKAGGKSLSRDQQHQAKTIVHSRREFIKRGAKNVDLQGFDTQRFDVLATRKNKDVFARESKNKTITGKQFIVLRDQKGRFVRRRIKK